LANNPGYVILKFGAPWCGPCKTVAPTINQWKPHLPKNVHYYDIDIDVNMEIYGYLKTRKMVNGIPCVLVYKRGNTTYIPDDAALGGNVFDINNLFNGVANGSL
jgi:thioredoxin 1